MVQASAVVASQPLSIAPTNNGAGERQQTVDVASLPILSAGTASPLVFSTIEQCGCCIIAWTPNNDIHSIGLQATSEFCCFDSEGSCCVARHNRWYLNYENSSYLSGCKWPRCYQQLCCLHLFSCYNMQDLTDVALIEPKYSSVSTEMDNLNAVPFSGLFCCLESCFCDCPACCSCVRQETFLCCHIEYLCYRGTCNKLGQEKDGLCCVVQKQSIYLEDLKTCWKGHAQCCCADSRCAVPCDADVPCVLYGLPCCSLCIEYKCDMRCCPSVGNILDTTRQNYGAVNPPVVGKTR